MAASFTVKERPEDAVWPEWAQFFTKALGDLANDRRVTDMGTVGAIPFSSYAAYAQHYDISGDDFEIFCYMMRRLDAVCVKFANRKKD